MTQLSVNINKIAVLRNSRGGSRPSVLAAARVCMAAGCHGLTVHPRPDLRHIRPADVADLADWLAQATTAPTSGHAPLEFNIEGNPFAPARDGYPGYFALCEQARPAQATLVPDGDGQLTSDHGFDLRRDGERLRPLIRALRELGCRVSLFMDVSSPDIERAAELGAHRVELYTGPYAAAFAAGDAQAALALCVAAAARAQAAGLLVNAGHDLDQDNLPSLLAALPGLAEVSIGHALIADALDVGLDKTVRRYLALLPSA